MSSIVNKIKDAVNPDRNHGAPEGTHGPHGSRVANAADPRVDSDHDNSRTVGAGRTAGHGEFGSSTGYTQGTHATHGAHAGTHTTGATSGVTGAGYGTQEGEFGPHGSRLANAADPRVDSDLDNSRTIGTGTTGTGAYGSSGTTGAYGAGSGATGFTGTHGAPEGTYGTHNSRIANAADPRIDSDRDGRGAIGTGPGPAPNTAGPHKSDVLNKVDPRVDSDMDASRTVGGNRTYQ